MTDSILATVIRLPEAVRPLGPAETWVARDNDAPAPRQQIEETPMLREIVPAMEKQQRRPFARG